MGVRKQGQQYGIGYVIFVVMIVLLVLYALRHRDRITYTVVEEVFSDKPFRTLIKKYIVVSGIPTEAELESKLNDTYQAILADAKTRLYYHEVPDVFISIYGTEEQAQAGNLWIGMLAKTALDKTIDLRINESRLAALSRAPEERFGLSEQRRKELFRAIASAEYRAECIALERIPYWHSQGPNQPKRMITKQELHRQFDLQEKLTQQYLAEVAQLYDLTIEDLMEPPEELALKLTVEANDKGWPPPPYPCE